MPVVLVAGASKVALGSITVDKPVGTQAGDVLVATSAESINSAYYITAAPAGWTALGGPLNRSSLRVQTWWKRAGASEPASYTWTASGTAYQSVAVVALRGCLPTNPPIEAWGSALSNTAPAVSVTSQAGMRLCLFGAAGTTNSNDIQPVSPLVEFAGTVGSNSFTTSIAGTGYTGPGTLPTGTATGTASGGTPLIAWTLALPSGNSAPNAPILTSPANGSTIDLSVTQRLAWTISDPDPGDSQSKFDLRYRLVGAGTWTDVTGTTPNQFWDAPPATFTAGDYEWQARTYDALGIVGPYSPSSFFTATTAPAAPTITAPISGATVAATDTITWSTPTQARYQARRVADNAGSPDTSTVYWDTGEVVDATARSVMVAFPANNRWEHVQVRVRYGGLWSPWADVRVQVSWSPPAAPTVVLTPNAATASIAVAITNPTPSGGEPAVSYNDVYLFAAGVPEWRAAGMVPANGSWTFWTPTSGVNYTARVVSVATNGTTAEGTAS